METITLLDRKDRSDCYSSNKAVLQEQQISCVLKSVYFAHSDSEDFPEVVSEEGLFAEFLLSGEPAILRLSQDGFEWIHRVRGITGRVDLCDIITIKHEEPRSNRFCLGLCSDDEGLHKLCIHSFERNKKRHTIWKPIKYVFASSDKLQISQWSQKANEMILQFINRPKRLWVFVNPYGGARQAPVIWRNQVKPLFELAGIQSHVVITKEANEAYRIMKAACNESLESIDGVVAIGGDGLFQEIMNGVLEQSQKPWSDQEAIHHRLRLGHIPAGSTDAVAWSVNGSRCPISSALRVVFGDRMPLDVMKIESDKTQDSRYSACLAGYGFLGDVISMSEHFRFFGPMRYDIAGVMAFFSHNTHQAKVSFIRSSENESVYQSCQSSSDQTGSLESGSESETFTPLTAVETVEDEFISVMITVNPCRSDKSPNGLIPYAQLSDGVLHVTLVQRCPRWQYLSFLISAAKQGIQPGQYPFVQTIAAKWVKVEPLNSQSAWNVDGEVIRQQGLTSTVHNGLVQIFARGVEQ
eukprot:g8967.t1